MVKLIMEDEAKMRWGCIYGLPLLFLLIARVYSFAPAGGLDGERLLVKTSLLLCAYSLSLLLLVLNNKILVSLIIKGFPLFFISAYMMISALWSVEPSVAIVRGVHMFGLGLVAICSSLWISSQRDKFIVYILFFFASACILSILFVFVFPAKGLLLPYVGRSLSRWIGVTAHPNLLGSVSAICIWAAVSCLYIFKNRRTLTVVLAIIPMAFVLLKGSDSRTALIVSVSFLLMFMILRKESYINFIKVTIKMLCLAFTLCLLAFILSAIDVVDVLEILMPRVREGASDSLSGRPEIWMSAVEAVAERPIGWAFDQMKTYWVYHGHITLYTHFHNGFLDVAAKGGFISLFFLFITLFKMILSMIRTSFVDPKFGIICFIFFSGVFVHNLAESNYFRESLLWSLLVVLWFSCEIVTMTTRKQ